MTKALSVQLTKRDLLAWVSRQQEDQQGQSRDEHAGDKQI